MGILGAAVDARAGAAGYKAARAEEYQSREYERRSYGRSRYGYRDVSYSGRGGYASECGVERRPVFDRSGEQVGWRRVPAC